MMKTLNLPEGNAFGADESDSATPYVEDVEQRAQTLFFVWVTLTEHKWVTFGERRGLENPRNEDYSKHFAHVSSGVRYVRSRPSRPDNAH